MARDFAGKRKKQGARGLAPTPRVVLCVNFCKNIMGSGLEATSPRPPSLARLRRRATRGGEGVWRASPWRGRWRSNGDPDPTVPRLRGILLQIYTQLSD